MLNILACTGMQRQVGRAPWPIDYGISNQFCSGGRTARPTLAAQLWETLFESTLHKKFPLCSGACCTPLARIKTPFAGDIRYADGKLKVGQWWADGKAMGISSRRWIETETMST